MGEAVWWLVAGLAAACAVLLGALLRRPRALHSRAEPAVQPGLAPSSPVGAARSGATAADATPAPGGLVPQPALPAPARTPVAALVAPPATRPPMTLVVARARRYELRDAAPEPVLLLERASDAVWQHSPAAAVSPMHREMLAAALTHAPLLAPSLPAADADLFRLTLRAGTALAMARGELAGAPGGSLRAWPAQSLDPARSAPLAAIVLALRCAPVYLQGLRAQVGAIQAQAAPLLKLRAPDDDRFKGLLQDLTRYLREVEENHAGVIRKPVFVARVADFCVQADLQWRAALDAAATWRGRLHSLLPALPEAAAVTEWRALWPQYESKRRIARCAARLLAAWHGLRLALGEAAPAAAAALRAALDGLHAAGEADAALGRALRAGGHDLFAPLESQAGDIAQRELHRTAQAIDAGFTGDTELTLLVRLDALGRVVEVRGPLAGD